MELFRSIKNNDVEELRRLLRSGIKTDTMDINNKNNTPLHYAVERNNEDAVRELLLPVWNVDVNARNVNGDTPLHVAAFKDYEHLILLLLEYHALNNIRNNDDLTFLGVSRRQTLLSATPNSLRKVQEDFYRKCVVASKMAAAASKYILILILKLN